MHTVFMLRDASVFVELGDFDKLYSMSKYTCPTLS